MNKKKENKEDSGYIVFKQVYLALDRPCYATKLNVCLVLEDFEEGCEQARCESVPCCNASNVQCKYGVV